MVGTDELHSLLELFNHLVSRCIVSRWDSDENRTLRYSDTAHTYLCTDYRNVLVQDIRHMSGQCDEEEITHYLI